MVRQFVRRSLVAVAALGLVAGLGLTPLLASAQTQTASINQQVNCKQGGNFQISLGVRETPNAVDFSESVLNTNAKLNLKAGMQGGCNQDGWRVTLVSSDMVANGVGTISAENVRAASLSDITRESGQPKLPTKGNVDNTPLNTPVVIMSAVRHTGVGTYLEDINLNLVIPSYTAPGVYATTLTATIAVGPS